MPRPAYSSWLIMLRDEYISYTPHCLYISNIVSIFALFTYSKPSVPDRGFVIGWKKVKLLRWGIVDISPNHTSWRSTACQLSATTYAVYSQLPSMSKGCLLHPHHDDVPCCGDTDPLLAGISTINVITLWHWEVGIGEKIILFKLLFHRVARWRSG